MTDTRALDFANSSGAPQTIKGRIFVTPNRVIRHNRVVHGIGAQIPWAEAVALGLVADEPTPEPIAIVAAPIDEGGEDEGSTTDDDAPPTIEPRVDAPVVAAAVRRRSTNRRGAK
jgi:hypothetical protein